MWTAVPSEQAPDWQFSPVLTRLIAGDLVPDAELSALVSATLVDPVASAFSPCGRTDPPADVVRERIELVRGLGGQFIDWWRGYFPGSRSPGGLDAAMTDLWRLYLPFSQWIAGEKRRRRPGELYMIGFNGSPGSGKTVLTNALAVVLGCLLDAETEGQPVARSGDDWYLGKDQRALLVGQGYDPGMPGVSNRGIPGTHDLRWLKQNLLDLEQSTKHSVISMGNFDKRIDDQPAGQNRYFEVRGKVGVLLFDLWFAGARTDADPMMLADGLRRRVAEHLGEWRTVFDRMDALWGFDWPPFEQMVLEREAQERLIERRQGARGMSSDRIRAFMSYMVERAWDWETTSPVPTQDALTFMARRNSQHRLIEVRKGGRQP
jgi:pantothenate kinase-related protein Tda10